MVIAQTTITLKRQITIPMSVMHKLNLHPGDALNFEDKNGEIHIMPNKTTNIMDLHHRFSKISKVKLTDNQMRQARADAWGSRNASGR